MLDAMCVYVCVCKYLIFMYVSVLMYRGSLVFFLSEFDTHATEDEVEGGHVLFLCAHENIRWLFALDMRIVSNVVCYCCHTSCCLFTADARDVLFMHTNILSCLLDLFVFQLQLPCLVAVLFIVATNILSAEYTRAFLSVQILFVLQLTSNVVRSVLFYVVAHTRIFSIRRAVLSSICMTQVCSSQHMRCCLLIADAC